MKKQKFRDYTMGSIVMSRSKTSSKDKLAAIEKYKRGEGSQSGIAKEYGVDQKTLCSWISNYESLGAEALQSKPKGNRYSKGLKWQAVESYLNGEGSQQDICKKYKILSCRALRDWIAVYNGHKELGASRGAGMECYMTKGRKTTLQERIEIVAFCIEHGKDYPLAIEKFEVSYSQIYSWVKKYEATGVSGLADRRGKAKPETEITEQERLTYENRILASKIKDLEMELALIKNSKS